jgi:hypothetical protein
MFYLKKAQRLFKFRCSLSIKRRLAFLVFASECQSEDTNRHDEPGQKIHYVPEYGSTHYSLQVIFRMVIVERKIMASSHLITLMLTYILIGNPQEVKRQLTSRMET